MSISATVSSTQSTYPVMINGYICFTSSEVQAARSGGDPFKKAVAHTVETAKTTSASQAARQVAYTAHRQLKAVTRGTTLNIYA